MCATRTHRARTKTECNDQSRDAHLRAEHDVAALIVRHGLMTSARRGHALTPQRPIPSVAVPSIGVAVPAVSPALALPLSFRNRPFLLPCLPCRLSPCPSANRCLLCDISSHMKVIVTLLAVVLREIRTQLRHLRNDACVHTLLDQSRETGKSIKIGPLVLVAAGAWLLVRAVPVPNFFARWHTSPTKTSARCRACWSMQSQISDNLRCGVIVKLRHSASLELAFHHQNPCGVP